MVDVTTLQAVELGVLGPLQVRQDGTPSRSLAPSRAPSSRCSGCTAVRSYRQTCCSNCSGATIHHAPPPRPCRPTSPALRRTLGDGFVLTEGAGWTLAETGVDASSYKAAARRGRAAAAAGDTSQAVARFEEALALWRGTPELPDGQRGRRRRRAGSRRTPRWWKIGQTRCSQRAAPRRSSANWKQRWPTPRFASGGGAN